MNIAFISSICKTTTLSTPGGQEVWGATFLLEAIKRGNTLDLFAVKDSVAIPEKIVLHEVLPQGKDEIKQTSFFTQSKQKEKDLVTFADAIYTGVALEIQKNQSQYDLIIDSSGNAIFPTNWNHFSLPLVVIGHFPTSFAYTRFFQEFPLPANVVFVFPSQFQAQEASWIPAEAKRVIHHGIILSEIQMTPHGYERMVWVGRVDIDMPKGLKESIEVATKSEKPLEIFGHMENEVNFDQQIKPLLSPFITLNSSTDKAAIFGDKRCLLFPIQWEEPFGLVTIESMSVGTPVIAFARGSMPEIIKDGVTGYLINPSDKDIRGDFVIKQTGIAGVLEAVEKIYALDQNEYLKMRSASRNRVEELFSVTRMVDQYQNLFSSLITHS